MVLSSNCDDEEAIDLYKQINVKIASSGLSLKQLRLFIKAKLNTPATALIENNKDCFLKHWPSLLEIGVRNVNFIFLTAFISELLKIIPNKADRKDLTQFLAGLNHSIELEFRNNLVNVHISPQQLDEILPRYDGMRQCIREIAKRHLNTVLKDRHKTARV